MNRPPLHTRLWSENRDLADACLAHPFVQGLGDGNLDRGAFRRYVAQDAFFLRAFFSAYALAAARCALTERFDAARRLYVLMGGVLEELSLHASFATSLEIDLDAIDPLPATSAYTDFLLRTAWSRDPAETVAAMTPCMRLYAFLGTELAAGDTPENPYRDWIRTYASAEFGSLAEELEALLDELAEPTPEISAAYRYALQCERDFFSAPLASHS